MKQRHKFESIVAETLLIPLYYRAKESRRKNPILNDKVAEGLVDSLEYDYSRFDGAKLSEVGCVVRGWFFDRAVRRFIGKHADAVVVNVGCGLDTRFQRIGDGKAVFYDMDLPEVIALRRRATPTLRPPCWMPAGWTTCVAGIPMRISSSWSKAC